MTHIEEKVIQLIKSRAWQGRAKYGVGMDRSDLDTLQWLQHLQEELLDAAVYAEKLKEMQRTEPDRLPGQAFAVGDTVYKPKGYKFPGVVVAAFTTLRGEWRYVVECTVEDVEGMLHIYNAGQLRAVEPEDSGAGDGTPA